MNWAQIGFWFLLKMVKLRKVNSHLIFLRLKDLKTGLKQTFRIFKILRSIYERTQFKKDTLSYISNFELGKMSEGQFSRIPQGKGLNIAHESSGQSCFQANLKNTLRFAFWKGIVLMTNTYGDLKIQIQICNLLAGLKIETRRIGFFAFGAVCRTCMSRLWVLKFKKRFLSHYFGIRPRKPFFSDWVRRCKKFLVHHKDFYEKKVRGSDKLPFSRFSS